MSDRRFSVRISSASGVAVVMGAPVVDVVALVVVARAVVVLMGLDCGGGV